MAGQKEGGPRGKAALTPRGASIAPRLLAQNSVAYGAKIVKKPPLTLKGSAVFYGRPGRESNPDHPRRQRGALSFELPGLTLYTVRGRVLFPTGQKEGPGFPGPWVAHTAQASTACLEGLYQELHHLSSRKPGLRLFRTTPASMGVWGGGNRTRIFRLTGGCSTFELPPIPTINTVELPVLFPGGGRG